MAREKQGRGAPLHTPGVVRSHVLHSQVRGCRPTAGCHPRIWGASRGPFPASDCGLGTGKPCELLVPGGFPCARLPSGCLVHLWGKALPLGRSVLRSGLVCGGLGRFRPGPGARKHRLTIILPPLNEPAEARRGAPAATRGTAGGSPVRPALCRVTVTPSSSADATDSEPVHV